MGKSILSGILQFVGGGVKEVLGMARKAEFMIHRRGTGCIDVMGRASFVLKTDFDVLSGIFKDLYNRIPNKLESTSGFKILHKSNQDLEIKIINLSILIDYRSRSHS